MAEFIVRIQRFLLKRKYGKNSRVRTFKLLKSASRVGVLYRADAPYRYDLIKKLNTWGEENHVQVFALGYVNEKELVGDYTPHRHSDYFCNKHLNKMRLPEKGEFLRFASEELDYLLNLYCEPCIPLLGISCFADAKFRVGPHLPEYNFCFDLMLKTDNQDVMSFTDEILEYLKTFGNGKV